MILVFTNLFFFFQASGFLMINKVLAYQKIGSFLFFMAFISNSIYILIFIRVVYQSYFSSAYDPLYIIDLRELFSFGWNYIQFWQHFYATPVSCLKSYSNITEISCIGFLYIYQQDFSYSVIIFRTETSGTEWDE